MRLLALITLSCLSACTWFGSKRPQPPEPTEFVVMGAPQGSQVLVDDRPVGHEVAGGNQPLTMAVAPGAHKIEVRVGDAVVYRENAYVAPGEHRVISVLSGLKR
jgi:hypothetical protein